MRKFIFSTLFILISIKPVIAKEVRVRLISDKHRISLKLEAAKVTWCTSPANCQSKNFSGDFKLEKQNTVFAFLNTSTTKADKIYITASSIIDAKGNRVPNDIEILLGKKLDLIARMDLEKYLLGVLPSEMPASWPLESLKAQAIASRTYVLYQIEENKNKDFDVESTVMDQVFKHKRLPRAYSLKMNKVLQETKNLMLAQNTKPIKAFFHSHCGGHTEMAANVWPGANGFETVSDPYCSNPAHNLKWNQLQSFSAIENAYKKQHPEENLKRLVSVMKGAQNLSGRVENVFLFFENDKVRKWDAVDLRAALGYSKIKSTSFTMQLRDKAVYFSGKGYGHGVGLCQHGAKNMAKLGKSFREILKHYYPSTKILSMNENTSKELTAKVSK
ncbi:MAG: SpoIID/LytB domain-containing protein [Bdellovibrionota bacterium]|nr:SpoIID/LytB domain-containing protein [Bdellovibrionota bacterium]